MSEEKSLRERIREKAMAVEGDYGKWNDGKDASGNPYTSLLVGAVYLGDLEELLDWAADKFPKPHKNYWDEKGHLVTWEETVTKWFKATLGGRAE